MDKHDLETLSGRLTQNYRVAYRSLLKTEKKNIDTPTPEFTRECDELRGYLRGIKKAIGLVEGRMADNDLFAEVG